MAHSWNFVLLIYLSHVKFILVAACTYFECVQYNILLLALYSCRLNYYVLLSRGGIVIVIQSIACFTLFALVYI
jgi:hypothetical protein